MRHVFIALVIAPYAYDCIYGKKPEVERTLLVLIINVYLKDGSDSIL